jgi:GAF domain-containing protein
MGSMPRGAARATLLAAVAEVARAACSAHAASVALLDEPTGDLVFAGVAGDDLDELQGARFPAEAGIAGEVLRTGRPVTAEDLSSDPRFARDVAVETGYRPDAIAATPITHDGRVVGVLSVLDLEGAAPSACTDVLALLATHAAAVLQLTDRLTRDGP